MALEPFLISCFSTSRRQLGGTLDEFSPVKDLDMVRSVLKSVFFLTISMQLIFIIDYSLGRIHIESMH